MLPLGLGLGAFPRSCTYCNAMACHIYPVLLRPTCLRYRHFPLRTSLLNFGITVSLCASLHIFAAAFRSERQWLRETAFMSLLLMPHVVALVTQVISPTLTVRFCLVSTALDWSSMVMGAIRLTISKFSVMPDALWTQRCILLRDSGLKAMA